MKKVYNFSSGPSILPREVFLEAASGVLEIGSTGLSILEISHRSKEFIAILEETESLVRELLSVPDEYAVLFLSGGASQQFYQVPMNLLPPNGKAAFIDTGIWSSKAIKETRRYGNVEVIASSANEGYTYIPDKYKIPKDATYLHLTSNNTIYGTQYRDFPATDIPLVCDMSSDIFGRPIKVADFALIYAGAQKNIGPAGTTLVILRKDLVGKGHRDIPTLLDYKNQIEQKSMVNTPSVFSIYVSMLNLRFLKKHGGIHSAFGHNLEKAQVLYDEIDRNPLFHCPVNEENRSIMNVVFDPAEGCDAEAFVAHCTQHGLSGLKGHRTRGGFRASIYNAMSMEGVLALVMALRDFEKASNA